MFALDGVRLCQLCRRPTWPLNPSRRHHCNWNVHSLRMLRPAEWRRWIISTASIVIIPNLNNGCSDYLNGVDERIWATVSIFFFFQRNRGSRGNSSPPFWSSIGWEYSNYNGIPQCKYFYDLLVRQQILMYLTGSHRIESISTLHNFV